MLINLSEILSIQGVLREYDVTLETNTVSFMGSDYEILDAKPIHITLGNAGKRSFSIAFQTELTLKGQCGRCLTDVTTTQVLQVDRVIDLDVTASDNLDDYDELSYIKDCNLDIDGLILNELYSLIPMDLVCKEDCMGICKVCGQNRNIQVCDCRQTLPDPRMAVFGDIFNQFKEV